MAIDYIHSDFEDAEPPSITILKHTYPRQEFIDHGNVSNAVCDPRGFEFLVHDLAHQFLNHCSMSPKLLLNKVVKEIVNTTRGARVKTQDGYSTAKHDLLRARVDSVYFTGEHTNSKYLGYVSGAYLAGIDTARDLIKSIKAEEGVRLSLEKY